MGLATHPSGVHLQPPVRQPQLGPTHHLSLERVPPIPGLQRTSEQCSRAVVRFEHVTSEGGLDSLAQVVLAVVDEVHSGPFAPPDVHASDDGLVLVTDDRLRLPWKRSEGFRPGLSVAGWAGFELPEPTVLAVLVVPVGGEDEVQGEIVSGEWIRLPERAAVTALGTGSSNHSAGWEQRPSTPPTASRTDENM